MPTAAAQTALSLDSRPLDISGWAERCSDANPVSDEIRAFIRLLTAPAPADCFNPWTADNADDYAPGMSLLRRELLAQHLNVAPRLILVGEAPGYRGCRVSGVPFTSERLIRRGMIPRVSQAYAVAMGPLPISTCPSGWAEPSASIVWPMLRALDLAESVVLWNACPWHPPMEGRPLTNRAPRRDELDAGLPILARLCDLYPEAAVVAVGDLAVYQLARLKLGERCLGRVRHPAYGGAPHFRQQLAKLLEAR